MVYHRVSPLCKSLRLSPTLLRPSPNQQNRFAHESYGGGGGNPKGENPQEQGSNPSAPKEHPGPPPPTEGQGSGGGPTKATESGHNSKEKPSSSSGVKSKESAVGGAQPKILNQNAPTEETEDVKQHNAEYAKRHDRTGGDHADEKVDPKFWSGRCPSILTILQCCSPRVIRLILRSGTGGTG